MSITWHRDHAASGWRSRAFIKPGGELVVYDDGDWFVCIPGTYQAQAIGRQNTPEEAKERAALVFEALTGIKPESGDEDHV